ncbi:hypothetical protein BH20ACT6_BH20ACT6_24540 [soil metagenome]
MRLSSRSGPIAPRRQERSSNEVGMVTSEYATAAVGASAVGCVLYLLVRSGFLTELIQSILDTIRIITTPVLPFPGLM